MHIKIDKALNENFEILGLLYMSINPEFISREYFLEATKEHNINGEELYRKLGGVLKRYVKAFQKEMVLSPEDSFFFEDRIDDTSDNLILTLQVIFGGFPHWVDSLEEVTEDEIRLAFIRAIFEDQSFNTPPDFAQTLELLKNSGLSADLCWKATLILESPKTYLAQLAVTIQNNRRAYNTAIAAVEKPLEKLLKDFAIGEYLTLPMLEEGSTIIPTLIHPASEIIAPDGTAFIGLYTHHAYKMIQDAKATSSSLLPALKALGDRSKFDILVLLKSAPRYNLELAEKLNLSAATVSHHMNVLLTQELVFVEKHDGRVYYSLHADTIKRLFAELESILL